jgi:hypothetical protein
MKKTDPDAINEKDIERMAREVGKPLPSGLIDKVLVKVKEIDRQKAKAAPAKEKGRDMLDD